MSGVLVDTCVLLDLAMPDPVWSPWSAQQLARCGNRGPVGINAAVFGELSAGYHVIAEVDEILAASGIGYWPIPREAAFLAGRCHVLYRRRGGTRTTTLPDFFIGAHAMVESLSLLTRDQQRFRTYFPTLSLICPTGS